MLSILITTRTRTKSLSRLLDSIHANRCGEIELLFGCDYDDQETLDFIKGKGEVIVSYPEKCSRCGGAHSNRHRDLLNPMARLARGKYLWGLNDDVEILTKGFDLLIAESVEEFLKNKPNRILYAKSHEIFRIKNRGLHQQSDFQIDFACYPILTKETIETLGFFVPDEIFGCNADTTLGTIFHRSRLNRFHKIRDVVVFDHIEEGVVNPNTTPPCYNNYTGLWPDIEKLNNSVDKEEYVDFDFAYFKLVFKCKSCGDGIAIGSNTIDNLITCPECTTQNYIDPKFVSVANQLKGFERKISGDLK